MKSIDVVKTIAMACGGLNSTEGRNSNASNSEISRWFLKKSVEINGSRVSQDDEVDTTKRLEVILHPNGRMKTSFLFNDHVL